jgi:hypothetical protein
MEWITRHLLLNPHHPFSIFPRPSIPIPTLAGVKVLADLPSPYWRGISETDAVRMPMQFNSIRFRRKEPLQSRWISEVIPFDFNYKF